MYASMALLALFSPKRTNKNRKYYSYYQRLNGGNNRFQLGF